MAGIRRRKGGVDGFWQGGHPPAAAFTETSLATTAGSGRELSLAEQCRPQPKNPTRAGARAAQHSCSRSQGRDKAG